MATAIPVWDSKAGRVTYKGTNYNVVMINNIAKKKLRSAAEEMVLAAYKRATALGTTGYKPQAAVPKPKTQTQINTTAAKPSSAARPYVAPKPVVKKTPTTPTGYNTPYGSSSSTSMSSSSSGIVPQTIPTYNMRTDDDLRNEASQSAASIYNPIMNALVQRQKDYEQARQLGRDDLAKQYGQQIADLKALALSAQTAIDQQKTSASQSYEQGQANLAQQTLSARNANTNNYDQLQGGFEDQLNQLGISKQMNPQQSAILRDKSFSDAMLQGMGNIGQTGLAAGKSASDTAMSQLAANNTSQFGSLQGQAGIVKDQGLRDLDMQTLQNVMQGNTDIGKTQSDWNAKAYELMKGLQNTEWSKYMDANQAAFGQGQVNAQLGIDAASAAGKSAEDAKQYMTPGQLGTTTLNSSIGDLSADKKAEVTRIWNLMLQPGNITTAGQKTPFGELAVGQQPAITDFVGDSGSQALKNNAYGRAYSSLQNAGLVSSVNDSLWLAFRNAMNTAMTGNKAYNLTQLG